MSLYQRKEMVLNGKKFSYLDEGSGERAALFLHGWADTKERYHKLIQAVDKKFRIIIPDLPGHGFSESLNIEEVSLEKYVELLRQFIEELELKKVNILGYSMGGLLSLMFTLEYPELVENVIVWESSADFKGMKRMQPFRFTFKALKKFPKLARGIKKIFEIKPFQRLIAQIAGEALAENLKRTDERTMIEIGNQIAEKDIMERMPEINVDVLLISGNKLDVHIAKRKMKEMERLLPKGLLKEVPSAQHYALDNSKVYAEIVDFLQNKF